MKLEGRDSGWPKFYWKRLLTLEDSFAAIWSRQAAAVPKIIEYLGEHTKNIVF